MFFLTGVSKFLFVPLAEAVMFAVIASYILAITLVPTLEMYLLGANEGGDSRNPLVRFQQNFVLKFEQGRRMYKSLLTSLVQRRRAFIPAFLLVCLSAALLIPFLGEDFFPASAAGEFTLHIRGNTGTRLEETARLADEVEQSIRQTIPQNELTSVIDNLGMPFSPMNVMYLSSGCIGASDGDITVTLNKEHHPTADYIRELRTKLPREFPGTTFYFLPADMTTQILNFGLPAPIDVQLQSDNVQASYQVASGLLTQLKHVPGLVDLRINQPLDYPTLNIDIDRTKATQGGFTTRDVAQSMLYSFSSSMQITPIIYYDWTNNVNYGLVAQTPQYRMNSLQDIQNIPINSSTATQRPTPEVLSDLASIHRDHEGAIVSEYNIRRVIEIYGAAQDRDLGGVSSDVQKIVDAESKHLPRGTFISVRGQAQTMRTSYVALLIGLVGSIVLVYLLIVVNFQSWLDPFIIITALPAALAGIILMLFLTHTTLSVPALMGAIMCMGVATSNSILVVSFAKERLTAHGNAILAAIEAGTTRFRPVIMTALAMIIGMVPMALGMGEGGEQNAPLGRAVIGGLICATVATLVFVPSVFALLHSGTHKPSDAQQLAEGEVAHA
jgi:multidrug efflux pump subunit AcrB